MIAFRPEDVTEENLRRAAEEIERAKMTAVTERDRATVSYHERVLAVARLQAARMTVAPLRGAR